MTDRYLHSLDTRTGLRARPPYWPVIRARLFGLTILLFLIALLWKLA